MFRTVLPALALTAPHSEAAECVDPCDPAAANGSPLVVCVGATGEVFRSAAFGAGAGPLRAPSDTGILCNGAWRRGFAGAGLAGFPRSGGRRGRPAFARFEPERGGNLLVRQGDKAQAWAGNNLEGCFREVDPAERQRVAGTPNEMLLG